MKAGAPSHSKMAHLARLLKIYPVMAVGLMEKLWHWTAAEIPDGGIGKRDDEAIAFACLWPWPRRSKEFVDALHTAGFLDEMPGCRLYVHNWHKHCEDSVHRRLAYNGIPFANGMLPKLTRLTTDQKQRALSLFKTQMGADSAHLGADSAHFRALPLASCLMPKPSLSVVSHAQGGSHGEGGPEEGEPKAGTGEGDEVHRILVACEKLKGLTYEQDLTARQFAPDLDFRQAAARIVQEAQLMPHLNAPGKFVRSWYIRMQDAQDSEKRKTAGDKPRNMYVPFKDRKPEEII